MRLFLSLVSCLILSTSAHSETFISDSQKTPLLELYTSEGCSSCPPADRWLSSLKNEDGLWKDFIPVAFHVDYWDYIGWKDQFASSDYTDRQRRYATEQSLRTVYTPGFIYQGKEWRGWFVKRFLGFKQGEKVGVLKMDVESNMANLVFTPDNNAKQNLQYHIAVLGFDVKTHVKRGENTGKTLEHDFVVLELQQGQLNIDNHSAQALNIPLNHTANTNEQLAVVAWVNSTNSLSPIQAVGGYLNKN